jgi:hypothetical protein
MQFGSTFRAEFQDVAVNCWADPIQDDQWKQGVFTVGYGQCWYYARLTHDTRAKDAVSDEYLIHDEVGPDGWGGVTIFRHVELIDNLTPNVIPRASKPMEW